MVSTTLQNLTRSRVLSSSQWLSFLILLSQLFSVASFTMPSCRSRQTIEGTARASISTTLYSITPFGNNNFSTDIFSHGDNIENYKLDGMHLNQKASTSNKSENRRSILFHTMSAASAAALSTTFPSASFAAPPPQPPPMVLPKNPMLDSTSDMKNNGLIESRVSENLLSPPPYGLEDTDIFYPSYFQGVWSAHSVTTSIEAPCGIPLFGGNYTYNSALETIGPKSALNYKCRFIPSASKKTVIADREYNVREIAKAAMGANAVVDIPVATPNKISCLLSPMGASSMMVADILTLARRQENVSEEKREFHCAEVVRQIVSPIDSYKASSTSGAGISSPPPSSGGRTTLLKEIETASLYFATPPKVEGGEVTEIRCRQRSATFLLPSQTDPIAYQLWQMSRGRPIDVRFFDVVYTKQA